VSWWQRLAVLGGWIDLEAEVVVERERERIKLAAIAKIKLGGWFFINFAPEFLPP
jgi:hypothetical protein